MLNNIYFVLIGLAAGALSGLFGIGGGVLIVPALIFGLGFSQKMATGTSLAILLPPVGIAAVAEYYRHGEVNFKAAILIAAAMLAGGWLGAKFAMQLDARTMRILFGFFLMILGAYTLLDARQL